MAKLPIHIPTELFAPAAMKHFEGQYDPSVLKAGPDLYTTTAPINWQVDATNTGDAILIMGTAESSLRTSCARCLEDADYELTSEIEGYFIIPGEGEAPEDMEGDEFDYLPEDSDIDLEPLIISGLMLELPLLPLCEDDCKGLCPRCGANLNEGPCDCDPEEAEAEAEEFEDAANPFAALKGLKFDGE